MDHPKPWLRYVDAGNIDDRTLEIDGMKVRNAEGEKLGNVDGFIVDSVSGRTYYIVVDAGGWFKTRNVLLPLGQVQLDADRDALVVSLSKEQIERFPGFDKDTFDALDTADIKRINDETCFVCEQTVGYAIDEPYSAAWDRPSYRTPDWWTLEPLAQNRETHTSAGRADTNDVSPHFDNRAQPGDVIGIETGGERTYVGDTKKDEDTRRQSAEQAVGAAPKRGK